MAIECFAGGAPCGAALACGGEGKNAAGATVDGCAPQNALACVVVLAPRCVSVGAARSPWQHTSFPDGAQHTSLMSSPVNHGLSVVPLT